MDITEMLKKVEKINDLLRTGKPDCEGNEITDPTLIDIDDLLDQIIAQWEY